MIQLNPREYFMVVRQIEDPSDSTTYYVRAVIRNAHTDEILATLDLEDKGSRRFVKPWLVPADPSGNGFWVDILTAVYTDSAYTVPSTSYGQNSDTHLVQERVNANLNQGGFAGPDISYKKIREIVAEETKKALKKQVFPKPLDVSGLIKEVHTDLKATMGLIKAIDIPGPTDLTPVMLAISSTISGIERVAESIASLPKPEKVNLEPISSSLEALMESLTEAGESLSKQNEGNKAELLEALMEKAEAFNGKTEKMKGLLKQLAEIKIEETDMKEEGMTIMGRKVDPRVANLLGNKKTK